MNLTLPLSDASGRTSKQEIALEPRAISRLSVGQLLGPAGLSGTYGGVKIETAAHAGSLDTVHVLFDENGGFSANLKMFDRDPKALIADRDFARTGVWTLRAPMLALEHPDPALALPSGTTLHPQLFIRNTTGNTVNATVRFNWRAENKTGRTSGPPLVLQPFETRLLDVSELPPGQSPPAEANWTAVTMTYSRFVLAPLLLIMAAIDVNLHVCVAQQSNAMERNIESFSAAGVTPLEALLRLGEQEQISFGVVCSDSALLSTQVTINENHMDVKSLLGAILRDTSYQASFNKNGVVLVADPTKMWERCAEFFIPAFPVVPVGR